MLACPLNVELSWMAEVSSSVYATPLITDLYSDGAKEVVVPSFVHYLEVSPLPGANQTAEAHKEEEERALWVDPWHSVGLGAAGRRSNPLGFRWAFIPGEP